MTKSKTARPLRGDKREKTRTRLLQAAAEVIGERGLDATSLEEIAQRAGMSRGAIYNNFRDKEDLFLAVAMSRWTPVVPAAGAPGETLRERMRRHGEAVADAAESRRSEAVGATSFVQYALRNEALRQRMEERNAMIYEAAAERLTNAVAPDALPASPQLFVRLVHALTDGLIILHALTPSLVSRDVIIGAFESLASAAPSPSSTRMKGRRAGSPPRAS